MRANLFGCELILTWNVTKHEQGNFDPSLFQTEQLQKATAESKNMTCHSQKYLLVIARSSCVRVCWGGRQVKRHKIVHQAHVIYLVRPLFVLFRERIEDFPNCWAPEVFYQVYSPTYVTH